MPQKKGEVLEEVGAGSMLPDTYENWLKKQIKARSGSVGDREEEDYIDNTEDVHKKAHRRKRGKGAAASSP